MKEPEFRVCSADIHSAFQLKPGVLLGPAGSWGLSSGEGLLLPGAQLQTYLQVCDRKLWSLGVGTVVSEVALRMGKVFSKYRWVGGGAFCAGETVWTKM